MKSLVHLPQMLVGDMRVHLCRRDVGMAEEGLDGSEVRSVFEQVSGERVADDVRRDLARDAGFDRVVFDDALD